MVKKPIGQLIVALGLMILADESAAQVRLQAAASVQRARLKPDSAEVSDHARDLQARFERWRRRALPKFYTGPAEHCMIVGRFCEWHPRVQDYVVPEEGRDIRRARADLLRDLEKASATLPGDNWIVGQRIRYLVESRDTAAIGVARSCRASKWWCEALLGFTLHVNGNFAAADSAFSIAIADMPTLNRCHWTNLSPLLACAWCCCARAWCSARRAAR